MAHNNVLSFFGIQTLFLNERKSNIFTNRLKIRVYSIHIFYKLRQTITNGSEPWVLWTTTEAKHLDRVLEFN